MNWLSAILGSLVGAAALSGIMLVREKIIVNGAVKAEAIRQVSVCTAQKDEIARRHNEAVDTAVQQARDAVAGIADPAVKADLIALCKASPECLDRDVP